MYIPLECERTREYNDLNKCHGVEESFTYYATKTDKPSAYLNVARPTPVDYRQCKRHRTIYQ